MVVAPPEVASSETLSRLRQAAAERDRLERVLLMLAELHDDEPRRATEVFAEAVREITGARLVVVLLPEIGNEPLVIGAASDNLERLSDLEHVAALTPAFDGEVVYISDVRRCLLIAEGEELALGLDGRELRSWVGVPISTRLSRSRSAMFLAHHRARAFSSRQVELAAALAAHFSHTLGVASAMAEQSRISTALQVSLLPPVLPSVPGLEFAACYRPSGRGNLVGGDFYDIFPDGVGGWNLLLGDASGVGPEAAGLAGIARYTARALGQSGSPPSEILRQLNRALLRASTEGRFCTAVLARLVCDGPTTRVSLGMSGHPTPYLLRANGAVEPVGDSTGTLLGVLEDAPVGVATVELAPGDALVFYTDGVLEARDERGEQFGEERIAEVLGAATGRSAEGIARRLELATLDHREPLHSDDVAIVVARHQSLE